MATIAEWVNGTSESQFEPSWKNTALKVINDIPSTWNGHTVTVKITSARRWKSSINSLHLYGLACDLNIVLDGTTILTGDYGTCNPDKTYTIGGNTYTQKQIYKETLGYAAELNGCRWGGRFSIFDPMHFDANKNPEGAKGTLSQNSDVVVVYEDIKYNAPSLAMEETAGNSTRVESGSPIVQPNRTQVYIGYDLSLSEFSTLNGDLPLRDLLTKAGLPAGTIDKLVKFNGVKGEQAYTLYQENSALEIGEDSASTILGIQVQQIVEHLLNVCNINTKSYPTEISTAIVSYLYGKNLTSPENVEDINSIKKILESSMEIPLDLARFIETKAAGLPSDIQSRRMSEVRLLRSYDPSKASSTSSLTSTENSDDYEGEVDRLGSQIDSQKAEIKNLLKSGNLFASDPASSEYDDTFNDIDQSTLDAIASIMQSQQVNSDLYFGFKDKEYVYRVKTKNFYTILSRALNCKISAVEKLVEDEPMLKDHKEYSLSKMYAMIPYATGIAYTVKKNAVKRCEYRIRLIEQRIKNNEASLIGLGLPSVGSFAENAYFLGLMTVTLGAVAAVALEGTIKTIFGSLSTLRNQLKLEKGNLAQLKKDMNRYSS